MEPEIPLRIDPPAGPAAQMAADEALVKALRWPERPVFLRIYSWDHPAVTYGRSQDPEDLPAAWRRAGIPSALRPTGGGAVLHSTDELTYAWAFSVPFLQGALRLPEIPAQLHRNLREELSGRGGVDPARISQAGPHPGGAVSLCFSSPVCGDLLLDGRKLAGCAIRAWRHGILVQGSIQGLPVSFRGMGEALRRAVALLPACFGLVGTTVLANLAGMVFLRAALRLARAHGRGFVV